jgi:3-hydroxyisobutyrate dehydrogenase-like beta-hydroxyacid dehydrogenase
MAMNSISQDHTKLGFIGIGAMGLRIAGRLVKNGFRVAVFDRDAAKASVLIESGGTVAQSIAELAFGADVVLSSLPNDDVVRSVYNGPQGVLGHIRRGSMIIEMSTVSPETSRKLYRLGSALSVSVLDVPVSGSTPAAEQGLLTLLGGGDEDSFNAAQAIFKAIGRQYFYLGPSGSGATMKLVVNTLLGVGMQAIAEAVAFGEKAGLDRRRLLEVMSKTAVVAPAHLGKLTKAMELDYRPEFAIGLMNKDFRLILETALAVQAPMPAAASSFPVNNAEFAEHPDCDFCAVINRMEKLAKINLARQNCHGDTIQDRKAAAPNGKAARVG